ncbi:MAG TPA: hypothetical protein VFG94_11090 [Acidimicrobiales bacterium]|nr:hypothetical protein [Acidimicrobiales bacterium]
MTHPFFAAEIARQRHESLRTRAAMARLRPSASSIDDPSPEPIRWDALADRMATDGPRSLEVEVRAVVRAARAAGADRTVVDVLADQRAPDVVRERAFGRLMGVLAGGKQHARPSTERSHDAA